MQAMHSFTSYVNQQAKIVLFKSKEAYLVSEQKVKNQIKKLPSKDEITSKASATVEQVMKSQNVQKLQLAAEKCGQIMTKNPKVTEYIVGSLIKATGIVPSDLKDTAVSAVKSKIAEMSLSKGAFLPYIQSVGTGILLDPTFLTVCLAGGCAYYYFYHYETKPRSQKIFKWKIKDSFQRNKLLIPKNVTYSEGQFNIKWNNLETQVNKSFKYLN